jgi:hypothetical protein
VKFQQVHGNWTDLRSLPNMAEVDFHRQPWEPKSFVPFDERMDGFHEKALRALEKAQADGKQYLMLRHGYSTSGRGKRSAASVVRNLMRSKEATPYIIRSKCLEHLSVFVAAIRPQR